MYSALLLVLIPEHLTSPVFTGIFLNLIDAERSDVVFFTCCPTG